MENAETDCRTVLNRLWAYLDGELPAPDCSEMERHFEVCVYCLKVAGFDAEFKAVVRRSCGKADVPVDLAERVRARLREIL
jgi:anti-sigma factor (TIGR02949 family)